jgi:dolichyl-phosphate-mannose-protein mannosyltransferase
MRQKTANKIIVVFTVLITSYVLFGYGAKIWSIHSDALGYYMYLPSTFIYHNYDHLEKLPEDKGINYLVQWSVKNIENKTPRGYTLNQYTYGVAFMELPFFFIAHAYEKATGGQANGYSESYNAALKLCALVYAFLGLVLLYKILRNYFTDTEAIIGVAFIFLGTNLFYFSVFQAGMSHVPLFFLYGLLIYLTIKLHQQPKARLFWAAGFAAGFITLIRPSDVLCLAIPLFYDVYSIETLRKKIIFLKKNLSGIVQFVIACVLPAIPQLLYWKRYAGSYFYYSYGTQSFTWQHPHILDGLFSFSNGWLPYSPVMLFSVAGIFLYKYFRQWSWCIWFFFPVYIYVIYSWFCYTYINGFGSRPMINVYCLLAIPLTAFVHMISVKSNFVKSVFAIVCLFFISLNISYSMQQAKGILFSDESSFIYNLDILYRMRLTYNDMVVKDIRELPPDTSKLTKLFTMDCKNFDDSVSEHYRKDVFFNSKYVYHMGSDEYMEGISVKYDKQKYKDAKWFKCSGKFMYTDPRGYFKHMLVLSNADNSFWKGCKIENKIGDWQHDSDYTLEHNQSYQWGYVYYFAAVPKNLRDGDEIKLYVWNTCKTEMYIDDLCLELYK